MNLSKINWRKKMLVRCDCKSEFQDKTYGAGIRVANQVVTKSGTEKRGRCTICGKEHTEKK